MLQWIIHNRKNIVRCMQSVKEFMIWLVVATLVCTAVSILTPTLNMKLINVYVYEQFSRKHIQIFAFYILITLISAIVGYWSKIYRTKVENKLQDYLNNQVITHAFRKQVSVYSMNEAGNADVLIKSDSMMYRQFVLLCILDYPIVLIKTYAAFVILVALNPAVAIGVFVLVVIVNVFQKYLCKQVEKQSLAVRMAFVSFCDSINEMVGNLSLAGPIGAKKYLKQKYTDKYQIYAVENVKQTQYTARVSLVVDTLLSLNVIVVLGVGSYGISKGTMDVGTLLSLVQYVSMFVGAFTSFIESTISIRGVQDKLTNIAKILSENEESVFEEEKRKLPDKIESLTIQELNFSYIQGTPIFEDANAEFEKGKISCICGASGSGKSTLLKLMLGAYNTTNEGNGKFDKRMYVSLADGRKYDLKNEHISYVPQENVFFTDSIYHNITLGENVEKEWVHKVCKECAIYDEIKVSDNGFDTIISNSIKNFSGGQVKRLSIARAILQKKEILLLDEPTSGLDYKNAQSILKCIRQYVNDKIVIIITHDEYLEKNADVVYRLEDRKLVSE